MMQSSSYFKVGTLVALPANVSNGSFSNEKYVSIPIEGKNITGFLSSKFIENDNKAVGVVLENRSDDSIVVFFSGELSMTSGNVVTVSAKWLHDNAEVINQKEGKNDSNSK
jgi:hypothetical protein